MRITDPIKNKDDIRRIRGYYLKNDEYRNFLLISFGLNTGLRISDILRLKIEDIFDFSSGKVKNYIRIKEKKTGKIANIKVNDVLRKDIRLYLKKCGAVKGKFVFESKRTSGAISRVQAYRIIKKATDECKIEGVIGCHSLRKTFGYFAWKNGIEPVLLMSLFNHSSFEITKRYLGIGQEEKDSVYMKLVYYTKRR